jgi:hypothetical protein
MGIALKEYEGKSTITALQVQEMHAKGRQIELVQMLGKLFNIEIFKGRKMNMLCTYRTCCGKKGNLLCCLSIVQDK